MELTLAQFGTAEISSSSPTELEMPENLRPRKYLEFAVEDLNGNAERNCVNAMSNAKRAMHFQTETISDALGYHLVSRSRNYPPRLQHCVNCGVVGHRILTKLNRLRNAIEHDYYIPQRSEAEDFVDVVELFLSATDFYMYNFPSEMQLLLYGEDDNDATYILDVNLPVGAGLVEIELRPHGIPVNDDNRDEVVQRVIHNVQTDAGVFCSWSTAILQRALTGR